MEPNEVSPLRRWAMGTITGLVWALIIATIAASSVGFWLSYAGLHAFAVRAGLRGPEAWAWPASVDLFILAGELGVTISALRHRRDWQAWMYLGLGASTSVAANVLHVDPAVLRWLPYAVAAVPPVAAMLALASLLRQVYRLAVPGVPGAWPAVPGTAAPSGPAAAAPAADAELERLIEWLTSPPEPVPVLPVPPAALNGHGHAALQLFAGDLAAGRVPGIRAIRSGLRVGQDRAQEVQAYLRQVAPQHPAGTELCPPEQSVPAGLNGHSGSGSHGG